MLIVQVNVQIKEEHIQDFIDASIENASKSINEPGIARFDILQELDNPNKFILNEVYLNDSAPAVHKETAHYKKWKETVADMMSEPRFSIKYSNIYPDDTSVW